MKGHQLSNLQLLAVLAILWGPSFLFIKIAVQEIEPLTLATLRIGIAAVIINTYLVLSGKKYKISNAKLKHLAIVGFFSQALPFSLINWGEQYIGSGLAAILNGLTPISAILIAHFATGDDRMTREKVVGGLLGFIGLGILVFPDIQLGVGGTLAGIAAVVIAAISYGIGAVYARVHLKGLCVKNATGMQLWLATIYLLPIALYVDGPILVDQLSWQAITSVLALSTVGTALAFILFYQLIEKAGPSFASFVTYLVPLFAVILGILILQEAVSQEVFWGATLIFAGAMILNKSTPVRSAINACKSLMGWQSNAEKI
jgi:drug/metabolite transporter (DMT)-like permease